MDNSLDEVTLRQKSAEYLFKIGNLLSSICPPASRFYMSNLENRILEFPELLKNKHKHMNCCYCGTIFTSSNCKIRTKARQNLNCHIKKLLKIERNEHWKLNSQQKKKLKRFYNSTSKMVYTCLTCKKTTSFAGSKASSSSLCAKVSTTSTPIPKLKLNKSDVNAGLFIPLPTVTSENEKSNPDISETCTDSSTNILENSVSSSDSLNIKESVNYSTKLESSLSGIKVSPELNSKKQASVKRKKTLLAQILDQEQKKKKKTTLSSFLVSL